MDCLVGWSLTKCIPHAVRYSAGRRMTPILRAAPRLPCNEPATGKGAAKLHAASSHAYRTSLQQVIVYRRTKTPPFHPAPHLTGRDTSKGFGVACSRHQWEAASERRGEGRMPLWANSAEPSPANSVVFPRSPRPHHGVGLRSRIGAWSYAEQSPLRLGLLVT